MNKKRFYLFKNTIRGNFGEVDKPLNNTEIVNLLNEQDKEIGLLRLELDTHKHPLWSTREAERKVNKLADSLADEVKKNGLLNEELNQLRKELKKEKSLREYSDSMYDADLIVNIRFSNGEWKADVSVIDDE